jgi:hypothetical protein
MVKLKSSILKLTLASFFLGCIFYLPLAAQAVDWYSANQATMAWTPVTTMDNGKAIPEGSIVKYQTYLNDAVADPDKKNPIDAGIVDIAEKTFTLTAEGKFYGGVRALRYIGTELVSQSIIIWSDDPLVCKDGKTFGLKFYLIPDSAIDLYPKTK